MARPHAAGVDAEGAELEVGIRQDGPLLRFEDRHVLQEDAPCCLLKRAVKPTSWMSKFRAMPQK